nr:hypothetical protein [Tanacetum cinerariifolium]
MIKISLICSSWRSKRVTQELSLISNTRGRAEVKEDDRPQAHFLGGKISSGRKKSQEFTDGDNIGDEGKIVGGAIGACSGICEKASEAKRSLVKSFEGLREVFPGEAGK